MTLPPQVNRCLRSGFTLLEVIIVLVVIATIFGGSLLLLVTNSDDEVHTIPGEIENLVKTSLEESKRLKQTHYLHIAKASIWLSTKADETTPSATNVQQVVLPKDSSISYKQSESKQWNTVSKKQEIAHLAFSISGICEPFSLRIVLDNSYAECSFHPLTGSLIQP